MATDNTFLLLDDMPADPLDVVLSLVDRPTREEFDRAQAAVDQGCVEAWGEACSWVATVDDVVGERLTIYDGHGGEVIRLAIPATHISVEVARAIAAALRHGIGIGEAQSQRRIRKALGLS